MSSKSERVKAYRARTKARIVESLGGRCVICGYNKTHVALALHHLDPSQKDISIGKFRASPRAWKTVIVEVRKCVLLCHNCHSEVHAGVAVVPDSAPRFDERYADYKALLASAAATPCVRCGNLKTPYQKYCSNRCSSLDHIRYDWDSIDLVKELETRSAASIAEQLGCSDGAVYKRHKKLLAQASQSIPGV